MIFAVCNTKTRRPDSQSGFTIVELMIVVAVVLCITAVALPSMMRTVANVRTRSTMGNLSGLMQRARSEAIRQNKVMTVHWATVTGETNAFVKDATSSATTPSSTDPQVMLGRGVQFYRTPPSGSDAPTAMTGTDLWGSSSTMATPDTAHDVSFNSRGLPCYYDTTSSPPKCDPKGFVYYFTYQPPFGANGWTAISVSPAGRIKSWVWGGTAWGN